MTTLPITLTIAAAAALINVWLGVRVTLLRRRLGIALGDGGNEAIATRMRAHANYIEYTPFFLILLAVVELAAGSDTILWLLAIAYIVGRLIHVFGMDRGGGNALRVAGMAITWTVLVGLAAYALALSYSEPGEEPSVSYADAVPSTLSDTKWLLRRS